MKTRLSVHAFLAAAVLALSAIAYGQTENNGDNTGMRSPSSSVGSEVMGVNPNQSAGAGIDQTGPSGIQTGPSGISSSPDDRLRGGRVPSGSTGDSLMGPSGASGADVFPNGNDTTGTGQ